MEIKIPEIGESILEALVANWLKKDGDAVAKDEIICELETDKVNVELAAEASGTLHIVVPAGQTKPIGTVIATLKEGPVTQAPAPAEKAVAKEAPAKDQPATAKPAASTAPPPANPSARQKAAEHGVKLEEVTGSGRAGRVTLDDVLAHGKTTAPKQ